MALKNNLVSLVAVLALLVVMTTSVSAFASITSVEVSGIETGSSTHVAAFAGQTLPVRVIFSANGNATDVRVKAWVSGDKDYSVSSERFDVVAGGIYSRFLTVQVPSDIDPDEQLNLEITIESRASGVTDYRKVPLAAQRESYKVDILDVSMDPKVQAGTSLPVDLVLKNRGRQFAEDTFVRARIPALGIESKAYFGDLSPLDQADPDKEDAVERRMFINIPASTPAGVYSMEFEAYSDDASVTLSRKFAVMGAASGTSMIVAPTAAKTVAVSEKATYSVLLVNSGQNVRVYDVSTDAPAGLSVEADESVVVVPAGTSKTVRVTSQASKAGVYPFTVSVYSEGELVKQASFTTTVDGKSKGTSGSTANTTVVLTVVLAIIFVVLLVVLIVLLTRKPQKSEEFGESYY